MTTVAELLLARAGDERTALMFEDRSFTWRQVVEASATRATWCRRLLGAGPPHVAVLLENVPEYLFWIGAAALSGAVVVGVNPTRRGTHLAADITHADCQMLVTDTAGRDLVAELDLGIAADRILLVDSPSYAASLDGVPGPDPSSVDESATMLLLFTSGSTGDPKAVVCSQGRLARIAESSADLFSITADDVCYQAMPLFHGNAIMANWLPALARGATVALRRRFSASAFAPDIRRFGATYFNYVGRSLAYVLAVPESPDDADNRLRLGFGTEASGRDMSRFRDRFGCELVENYGSSEGAIVIHRQPGTPEGALGRPPPLPTMDVVVVRPGTGEECPPARFDARGAIVNATEAIGELVNRAGAPLFEGYYKDPAACHERLRGGWYWSGDLAYRDSDGWFYFAGRSSDWLRVDSENFAAGPIERILARYEGVVMAAVYAVPDPRTGDQVMAALELEEGASFDPGAFARFLHDQVDLGTKWAPRFARVVTAIPLTASAKVDKGPLRASGWWSADSVWWRPPDSDHYRLMGSEDVEALRRELQVHGRSDLVHGP